MQLLEKNNNYIPNYVQEFIVHLLLTAFSHLSDNQIKIIVTDLFNLDYDILVYKVEKSGQSYFELVITYVKKSCLQEVDSKLLYISYIAGQSSIGNGRDTVPFFLVLVIFDWNSQLWFKVL